MKTIFLAAGSSSRMKPISDKNFLSFGGEPLILKLLKNAQAAGCDDFIIVSSQDNNQSVIELCAAHDFLNEAQIVIQPEQNGMAGGISVALEKISDDESVLILNGNDLVESEIITEVINVTQNHDGAILGQMRDTYFPGGYLKVSDNKVTGIIEKPGEGNEPSDLVNIVVHGFARAGDLKSALQSASSQNDDVYEVALDQCFKEKDFQVVRYNGLWQAIKYPWHVLEMMDVFFKTQDTKYKIHDSAEIADSVTIKGKGIIIESGVKIYENAVISGPCYLGKNVIVGNNALVRGAHIGENSVVGYNTEIARSWLSNNVTTHIAYIGDSVVESGVNFGAYSCTANLRLDQKTVRVNIKDQKVDSGHSKFGAIVGKNAQIGVGAKLMPGAKVEPDTHVRPNEVWF